tara:strand:- start:806 stop:1204 length:399 start_codon:yes stop_codon:yes gene_type:complete
MKRRWILRSTRVRDLACGILSELKLQEEPNGEPVLELILRPFKEGRSLEQNDMFHAWCGSIAEKTGHSKAEIKDILLETVFGTEEYLNLNGDKRTRLRQTSGLNKNEMSELIERSVQIGIELGADIPEVKYE